MAQCLVASLNVNSPSLGADVAVDDPISTLAVAQPSSTLILCPLAEDYDDEFDEEFA